MSNTLFRKGLVAAAIAGLAATAFAGTPAFADANVLFVPTTGTGNTLISGETFSLTASLGSLVPADKAKTFKFKVDNTSGVAATVKINGRTIAAAGTSGTGTSPLADPGSSAAVLLADGTSTALSSALTANTTSKVFALGGANTVATSGGNDTWTVPAAAVPSSSVIADGSSPVITIGGTDSTKNADYTITAFLDTNNNGVQDAGEFGTSQVVHFVTAANSGVTTTFTKPLQNSSALKAVVNFGSDINAVQLNNQATVKVGFGVYGQTGEVSATTANTAFGTAGDLVTPTPSSTAGTWTATASTTTATATVGATYSAKAFLNATGIGTEATQVVAATTDADATALTVAPTVSANVYKYGTGDYRVRAGQTSTSVSVTIKKTPTGGSTAVAVGAGVAVDVYAVPGSVGTATFGATPSGSTTADTLTVAGKALVLSGSTQNTSTTAPIATLVTDANGVVTVPVLSSLGTAGDIVNLTLKVENAASAATGDVRLTWEAAALAAPAEIYSGDITQTVVKGSSVTKKFALADQFGALYSGSAYELLYTVNGINSSTGTAATPVNVYAPFVNGVATVTYTDNALAAGTNHAFYQILKNVNGAWVAATDTALAAANALNSNKGPAVDTNVIAASQTAAAVTASATNNSGAVNTGANSATNVSDLDVAGVYAAGDSRLAPIGNTASTASAVDTISGVVTDASGVGVAGAQVTVAAPGALFTDASGNVLAVGSITVNATTNGSYSVSFATHTAGTNSVTVTSGAATKTISVYVAAAASNTGTVLTITAPATLVPGQSANATVKLTDKYGNPVKVTDDTTANTPTRLFNFAATTGVGTVTAKQTATAADGTAVVTITTGSADAGTITLTANYSNNASTTNTITATQAVKVAAPAATAATVTASLPQAQVGSAVDIAVATGVAGVTVTFTNAGTAYLSAASAVTDAKGNASVKLVGNVAGLNTVTATANGAAAKTTTVAFGHSDANLTASGKTVTAAWNFAGGKKVVVAVNGVTVKKIIASDDTADSYTFKLAKGTNKVTVSVAGVVTDSLTVKVKK